MARAMDLRTDARPSEGRVHTLSVVAAGRGNTVRVVHHWIKPRGSQAYQARAQRFGVAAGLGRVT